MKKKPVEQCPNCGQDYTPEPLEKCACGKPGFKEEGDVGDKSFIRCSSCSAETPLCKTVPLATRVWNVMQRAAKGGKT